jgi:hypothetical protein
MPELQNQDAQNAYAPITEPQQIPWEASPEDRVAAAIVLQDLATAESYAMQRTFQTEYDEASVLYTASPMVKYWPGTNLPRASVSVPLVATHVNSLVPQLMENLFVGDPPFTFEPRPGTPADAARAATSIVAWELVRANVKGEMDAGCRAMALFGTGVWRYGWEQFTTKRTEYRFKQPPLPISAPGGDVHVITEESDELEAVETEIHVSRPTFKWVDSRHILVDPACAVGDIRAARFVIHRQYLTAADLDRLREHAGYKIPDRDTLRSIFLPPKEATYGSPLETLPLPLQREFAPTPRWEPTTADPLEQPIEVLERWDRDSVITILNRKVVIRNERHEFDAIPFLSCNFVDIPGAYYGLGVARLIGSEQRIQAGIINARLDEIALNLAGMFVRKRGSNALSQSIVVRPGGVLEDDDPQNLRVLPRLPAVPEAFAEVEASEARAERSSAASELVVQGALPTHGRSSITRTATGVSALANAAGARLEYLVEKLAYQVFEPTLRAFWQMSRRYLRPSEVQRILSDELQQAYNGSPLDIYNADVEFSVLAASKMSAKRSLAQALPIVFQFLLQGPLAAQLAQQGEKIDVGEAINLLFDATGYRDKQSLIKPLSPQDRQQLAANNPATQQIAAQQHQAQIEAQLQQQKLQQQGQNKIAATQAQAQAKQAGQADVSQKAWELAQRLLMEHQYEKELLEGQLGQVPGFGDQAA